MLPFAVQFQGVPILGLTATATGNVLEGVKDMLGIKGWSMFLAHAHSLLMLTHEALILWVASRGCCVIWRVQSVHFGII